MGDPDLLETVARIVELGGAAEVSPRIAALKADFEKRSGAFSSEDPWFEERSRVFWLDAVTRGRLGRDVADALEAPQRRWLEPLERAHRGLFRVEDEALVDVWSGAVLIPTLVDDASRAELDTSEGQLFDARIVGGESPPVVALLPGAFFHPSQATGPIEGVLDAARAAGMETDEVLDKLLLMERTLRSLSRVKAAYAYRAEALAMPSGGGLRRSSEGRLG
jgi:hypothetical protein